MASAANARTSHYLHTGWRSLFFIFTAAFALRIFLLLAMQRRTADLSTPYVNETTSIAASIASGRGFASPFLLAPTGPTSWLSPIFPFLIAEIFRLCGVFTTKSLVVIQILNCFFASITIFPIYALAKRSFGLLTGVLTAWLWVFLPFAWWAPIHDLWDTALSGFLFASVVWATLAIRGSAKIIHWFAYGALWAIAALVNPSVLSVLPFLLAWHVWESGHSRATIRFPSIVLLTCALLLCPWTIRNHRVLGKWIPLRSNFGFELWLGNNPGADDLNSFTQHPLWNPLEAAQFQRQGEIAYIAEKQRQALAYIRSHPGETSRSILRRLGSHWFSVTDRPRANWSAQPLYVKALFLANFLMLFSSGLALLLVLRRSLFEALPYLTVLLIFPIPYYLTHTLVRYRYPLEPILTILAAYGVLQTWLWVAKHLSTHARDGFAILKPIP